MKKVYLMSIFMALVVGLAVYFYADSLRQSVQPAAVQTRGVVLAVTDIPANTQLTEEMLVVVQMPPQGINSRAVTKLSDAVGKITRYPLSPQEQLIAPRLYEKGDEQAVLSYQIEEGYRALSVGVNAVSGVSGYITPGDYLDIVCVMNLPGEVENSIYPASLLLLEDVLVLETGLPKLGITDNTKEIYNTLTLALTPDQALKLSYALVNGEVTFMLRPTLDHDVLDLPEYTVRGSFAPADQSDQADSQPDQPDDQQPDQQDDAA